MKLSEHFTLSEFTFSQTATRNGIDNTPSDAIIENLKLLCIHILEPIRVGLDKPMIISSGYRCPALNKAVKSYVKSQHTKGLAADFTVYGMNTNEVFNWIRTSGIIYDQLINEFNGAWVHVSYATMARMEVLYAIRNEKGKTIYIPA